MLQTVHPESGKLQWTGCKDTHSQESERGDFAHGETKRTHRETERGEFCSELCSLCSRDRSQRAPRQTQIQRSASNNFSWPFSGHKQVNFHCTRVKRERERGEDKKGRGEAVKWRDKDCLFSLVHIKVPSGRQHGDTKSKSHSESVTLYPCLCLCVIH